ncbi:MAG: phasin family protein [Deltaproteobacteria bacterium]|nr:phasin family protein [Deltaproteobacteria bacterium]MBN2688346.1 phasin family protein [Deltaproteobacteria bacterium]
MKEFVRKSMLFGIGLATLTREKIEDAVDELIKKGEMSEKEGRETIDDLVKRSKAVTDELAEKVEKMVAETLRKLNIPTRDEYLELKDKVERLESSQKKE